MALEYRQLVDGQQVCACRVHVRVDDRDLAVRITRRIRAWLPTLLAMSASSPFFQGEDTGYASYRTVVGSRWPTVGPPPDFASAEEYDRTVATLIHSGVISDAGMIYFDARLSARYPTVEIRVADACPSVDDAVLIAALGRALVVTAAHAEAMIDNDRCATVPQSPQVLLRAATWRAARSGLDEHLIDPRSIRPVPATDVVRALLVHVRPALEELGDWAAVIARDLWRHIHQTNALISHYRRRGDPIPQDLRMWYRIPSEHSGRLPTIAATSSVAATTRKTIRPVDGTRMGPGVQPVGDLSVEIHGLQRDLDARPAQ